MSFIGDPEQYPSGNADLAAAEVSIARPDFETDTRAIAQRIFDRIAERFPGWVAHDSNLEVALIEEFSAVAAEIRTEAAAVPEAIFQAFIEGVYGILAAPAQPATGLSTWTAVDDLGYQIDAGTQLTLTMPGDAANPVPFEVLTGAEIPAGETTVEGVRIVALENGAQANNLAGQAELIDPLTWVDTVQVPYATTSGADGETREEFLTEIIGLFRVVGLRPILPWDFAQLALRIPGVGRAVAMDGYEPADQTWGHARQVTVIVMDEAGQACSQQTMNAVQAYLEELREVNWIVRVIAPDYEDVDVAYQAVAFSGQDPDTVREICDRALAEALAPAQFRLGTLSPSVAGGEVIPAPQDPASFTPGRQLIRINDIVGLLDRQRGVDYVVLGSVTVNGTAQDHELPGPTWLPQPGQIDGEVTVP